MKLRTTVWAPLALTLLFVSLLSFGGCPPPAPIVPALGDTVAYWKFDGTPLDFSHHGHTAVPHGTIHYTEDIYGRRGMGLYLDGHGFLTVPDSVDLHITKKSSYTIITWVRTLDSAKLPIIGWNSASGHAKLEFSLSGGKPNVVISAVPQTLELKGNVAVNDGHWHMLTLTVGSPHTVDIYVDSNLVGHSATGALMPTDSAIGPLYIGATSDTLTLVKSAQLDEFLFLKVNLNAPQVRSLMTDGGIPTGPPVGICNPSGGKLFAVGTDGFHGTWQNTWSWVSPTNGDSLHAVDYSDPTHTLAVGYRHLENFEQNSNGVLVWANIPAVSALLNAHPDYNLMDVKILSPKIALVVGGTFDLLTNSPLVLLLTTPTANDWASATYQEVPPSGALYMFESIAIAPDSTVWIAGKNGQLFRTPSPLYGNPTWTAVSVPNGLDCFRGIDFMPVSGSPMKGLLVTDDGYGYELSVVGATVSYTQPVYTGGRSFWTARCSNAHMYAGATGTNPNPTASAAAVTAPYTNNTDALYIDWAPQGDPGSMPVNSWFASARSLTQTGVYLAETRNRRVILK